RGPVVRKLLLPDGKTLAQERLRGRRHPNEKEALAECGLERRQASLISSRFLPGRRQVLPEDFDGALGSAVLFQRLEPAGQKEGRWRVAQAPLAWSGPGKCCQSVVG